MKTRTSVSQVKQNKFPKNNNIKKNTFDEYTRVSVSQFKSINVPTNDKHENMFEKYTSVWVSQSKSINFSKMTKRPNRLRKITTPPKTRNHAPPVDHLEKDNQTMYSLLGSSKGWYNLWKNHKETNPILFLFHMAIGKELTGRK